jgi:two-component system chemotaxis response regulator CheY
MCGMSTAFKREKSVYRILLVDDSRVMRRMLQNTLIEAGFTDCEFLEAVDGQDALKKLVSVDYKVDAVFCDLCMPNMDGLGLLDALAEGDSPPRCPVIVLTADARKTHGREALLRGATALLRKPFTSDDVVQVLQKVLVPRQPSGD